MKTLVEINSRYEEIQHSTMNERQKDVHYTGLMILLKRRYNIPTIRTKEWENKNKKVMSLYRKLARSRELLKV